MNMKYGFFLVLTNIVAFTLYAQRDDGLQYIKNAGTAHESFEKITYYKNTRIPFHNIIVVDKRYDSSKTGYTTTGLFQNGNAKITIKETWSSILNKYFEKNLDASSPSSLVIVLKSFWLQKGTVEHLVNKKVIKKPISGSYMDEGGCATAELDIYVQTDTSLQALFRIDTSFLNLATRYNKNRVEDFFFLPFDSIARRLHTTNVADLLSKKRKLSWDEVHTYYDNRFSIPALKEPIKKGVFRSFSDFKNNKPFETNFKFTNGRVTDELYIVGNGTEELVSKYWGFYDGNHLYIQAGLSAFKTIRQQNTFELYGSKHLTNYHNNGGQNDLRVAGYSIDRQILQLNMDTGELY